jgi:hypothetical protein
MPDTPKMSPEALSKLLASLTPEQLATIRQKAVAAGLPAQGSKIQRLAGGALRLSITLPAEVAEPLLTWADAADEATDEKLHPFLEKIIVDSATAFVFQDWGGAERAAETPKPAGGVPTGTPAMAPK